MTQKTEEEFGFEVLMAFLNESTGLIEINAGLLKDFVQKIRLQDRKNLIAEIEGKKEEHQHSIYTHCRSCHTWGVNMPNDKTCGNCENTEDTTTYFPDKSFNEGLDTVLSIIKADLKMKNKKMKLAICPQCKTTVELNGSLVIRLKQSSLFRFHKDCLREFGQEMIKMADPLAFKDTAYNENISV